MKIYLFIFTIGFSSLALGQDAPGLTSDIGRKDDVSEPGSGAVRDKDLSVQSFDSVRNFSLGAALPDGGSHYLNGALSFRYFIEPTFSLSLILLGSYYKQSQEQSMAAGIRAQNFFSKGRGSPYFYGQLLGGQNTVGQKLSSVDYSTDLEFGVGTGLGIEVWVIPQLSLAIETGLSIRLSPSSKVRFTTGTSKVGLYVHN